MTDYLTDLAERIRRRVDPSVVPDEPEILTLFRTYALLALVKGPETTREDVHDAWVLWMVERDHSHQALLPFSELTDEQKRQDEPFLDAIHDVSSGD
ncbi:MAG TPA: hypothetical protein VLK37_04930 [Solirubrobacterales bacterium]|nr:hypothetical protein [Solirubrobacterales bacterium]